MDWKRRDHFHHCPFFFSFNYYSDLRKFSDNPWAKLSLGFEEAGPSGKGLKLDQIFIGPRHWNVFTGWEWAWEAIKRMRQGIKSRSQRQHRDIRHHWMDEAAKGWGGSINEIFQSNERQEWGLLKGVFKKVVGREEVKLNVKPIQ